MPQPSVERVSHVGTVGQESASVPLGSIVSLSIGWSCLHWAAYKGNPVLALALVHAGASRSYQRASTTLSQVPTSRLKRVKGGSL